MTTGAPSATRTTPAWFDEAKLGIFITWSAAAIPAFAPVLNAQHLLEDPETIGTALRVLPFAEMYQNTMSVPGSRTSRYHAEQYGELPYDAFVERFREELVPGCDPGQWADVCAASGARYAVLTTKIEDGFLLWPSTHPNPHKNRWQADRDVVGEFGEAVRARGLRFGTYYCTGMDWSFGGAPVTDVQSVMGAMPRTDEYVSYAGAHWRELIDRYEPSILWNDFGFPEDGDPDVLFGSYWARVPDGVVNDRFKANPFDPVSSVYADFTTPEYSTETSRDRKWEVVRAIGTSFGYNRQESDRTYLDPTALIHMFVDIVARGGNLLLGVGPTATGEIPWGQAQRLLALGWWLRSNGGAIFGTRPWRTPTGYTDEGLEIRYTTSDDAVHAIILGTPKNAIVELDVTLVEGAEVQLHGSGATLNWSDTPVGVRIELPEPPASSPALSFRICPANSVRWKGEG